MLHRDAYSGALYAVYLGGAEHSGKERILAEILEAPAAQGIALDVHAGAEQSMHAVRPALAPYRLPHPAEGLGVPA